MCVDARVHMTNSKSTCSSHGESRRIRQTEEHRSCLTNRPVFHFLEPFRQFFDERPIYLTQMEVRRFFDESDL